MPWGGSAFRQAASFLAGYAPSVVEVTSSTYGTEPVGTAAEGYDNQKLAEPQQSPQRLQSFDDVEHEVRETVDPFGSLDLFLSVANPSVMTCCEAANQLR